MAPDLTELGETIRTGEPQAHRVFAMGWWDYLNANPQELANFGEATKANSQNSMQRVLEQCDLIGVNRRSWRRVRAFGHRASRKVFICPRNRGGSPGIDSRCQTEKPGDAGRAPRLEYPGQDFFKRVPLPDAYTMKHIIHDWDDEHCLQLVRNCHQSMEGRGREIEMVY